jgi:hypothetical protein
MHGTSVRRVGFGFIANEVDREKALILSIVFDLPRVARAVRLDGFAQLKKDFS